MIYRKEMWSPQKGAGTLNILTTEIVLIVPVKIINIVPGLRN